MLIMHHLTQRTFKKHELGFESLPHPPYFPDTDSSDNYYLFPYLMRWLCGRRFESNEEAEWENHIILKIFFLIWEMAEKI